MIHSRIPTPTLAVLLGMIAGSVPVQAADAAAGAQTYATKCRTCHGKDGDGNPAMAKALKVDIKPLSSADVQKKSDDELKKNITDGVGKMKAVSALSAGDVDNLVAHVRLMKK